MDNPAMGPDSAVPAHWFSHFPDLSEKRVRAQGILRDSGTPVFLADGDVLIDRFTTLDRCVSECWGRHAIGYSFKTNYLIAECGVLQAQGAWAEVVSGREYRMAKGLGYEGGQIIFNGPYKTDDDLRTALEDGAIVNINDHDELNRLVEIVRSTGNVHDIGIRLSATIPHFGHSRFGFSVETGEAELAVGKISDTPNLRLIGCHTHIHGDADDPECFRESARKYGAFIRENVPDYKSTIKFLDLGGGFPAHGPKPHSRSSWNPLPIETYVNALTDELTPMFPNQGDDAMLILEPGRYLVADCAVFVSRVISRKETDGHQSVTSDGSIAMMPLTHYCPQVIRAYTPELTEKREPVISSIVYGPTCRENDILYKGHFPQVEIGDYLVHYASGAYNSNLDPGFIFEKPVLRLL